MTNVNTNAPHAAEHLDRPARGVEDRAEQVDQVVEPHDPERGRGAHDPQRVHREHAGDEQHDARARGRRGGGRMPRCENA